MLRLARLRSSTQNGDGKAVFQVTVSLNIRKDNVAETLPPFPWERMGKLKQAA